MIRYLKRIWSAFSQFLNVLFLFGHPNESISGRSYREGWAAKKLINVFFFWQADHCKVAYDNDLRWATEYINQHNAKQ